MKKGRGCSGEEQETERFTQKHVQKAMKNSEILLTN